MKNLNNLSNLVGILFIGETAYIAGNVLSISSKYDVAFERNSDAYLGVEIRGVYRDQEYWAVREAFQNSFEKDLQSLVLKYVIATSIHPGSVDRSAYRVTEKSIILRGNDSKTYSIKLDDAGRATIAERWVNGHLDQFEIVDLSRDQFMQQLIGLIAELA